MNPIDTIKSMTHGLEYPRDEESGRHLVSAYYDLTLEQAKDLASGAVRFEDPATSSVLLLNLALLVPGSVAAVQRQLLDRELFNWAAHFYQADLEICEELAGRLQRETDGLKKYNLVEALAWAGGETAQKILWEHAHDPLLFVSDRWTEVKDVIPTAGWELTQAGKRRDLFFTGSYTLQFVKRQGPEGAADHCPWCSRPLQTPFQLDMSDPRLHFLGLADQEIQVATCFNCVQFAPLWMDSDTRGRASWSPANVRPDTLENFETTLEVEEAFMQYRLQIGTPVRSPYELAAWLPGSPNRLGGFPGWVQDPDYPVCPACQKRMKFLAQFDLYGVYYAFMCPKCGTTAATSQFD